MAQGALAGVVDGRVEALLGCNPHPNDAAIGIIWLLGSDELTRMPLLFTKVGKWYTRQMIQLFPKGVCNQVWRDNGPAVAWLRAIGYQFNDEPLNVNGNAFLFFYARGNDV